MTGPLVDYTAASLAALQAAYPAPTNGMSAYATAEGKCYDAIGGAWVAREAGGTFSNMSTTVAGKGELATDTEGLEGTSTGGTGAPVVIGGGNKVLPVRRFVLSGTVSARDLVKVTNDAGTGKAARAVTTVSAADVTPPSIVTGNTLQPMVSVWIPDRKQTAVVFFDSGAAPAISVVLYDEYNQAIAEERALITSAMGQMHAAYDTVNKALVVLYSVGGTNFSSVVFNMSSDAYVATAVEVDTSTNTKCNIVYDTTSGKLFAVYSNSADASKLYGRVGTVASGTISWGAAAKIDDAGIPATTGAIGIVDCPNEGGSYVIYTDGANVKARLLTVAAGAISAAAAQTLWGGALGLRSINGSTSHNLCQFINIGGTMVGVVDDESVNKPRAIAFTSTGGTITAGSLTLLEDAATATNSFGLAYLPTTGLYYALTYRGALKIYSFAVTGTTVGSIATALTLTNTADLNTLSTDTYRERLVATIRNGATANHIKQIQPPGDYSDITNIHGVAQAAGVATDTVAVSLPNSLVTGFSSQTPGTVAYALGRSIQTTYATKNKVGQFLSDTELYFDPKQLN